MCLSFSRAEVHGPASFLASIPSRGISREPTATNLLLLLLLFRSPRDFYSRHVNIRISPGVPSGLSICTGSRQCTRPPASLRTRILPYGIGMPRVKYDTSTTRERERDRDRRKEKRRQRQRQTDKERSAYYQLARGKFRRDGGMGIGRGVPPVSVWRKREKERLTAASTTAPSSAIQRILCRE